MGLNIKRAIKERGLTSKQVAARMGMTAVNLSYHITGNPSVEILQRIANALGCDVVELFDPPTAKHPRCVCPHCGKEIQIELK